VLGTGGEKIRETEKVLVESVDMSRRTSPIFLSFPGLLRENLRPALIPQFFLFFSTVKNEILRYTLKAFDRTSHVLVVFLKEFMYN